MALRCVLEDFPKYQPSRLSAENAVKTSPSVSAACASVAARESTTRLRFPQRKGTPSSSNRRGTPPSAHKLDIKRRVAATRSITLLAPRLRRARGESLLASRSSEL